MSADPEIKEQLNRIERCLTGDPAMGQTGLVAQVADQGRRITALERVGIYVAGGGGVLGVLWAIWTQWPR
jgi:histidinol dehydrogenase